MNTENRIYMVLYPNTTLIASQYDPDMFAKHYTSGSSRHYSGKLYFLPTAETWFHLRNKG